MRDLNVPYTDQDVEKVKEVLNKKAQDIVSDLKA